MERRLEKRAPILPNVEYGGGRSFEAQAKIVAKKVCLDGVDAVLERFRGQQYIADRSIGMAVYLAVRMGKPLLVEGEPGCGKTEIARSLAAGLDTNLIRLQCYEGLDADATLYEWNHPKQLLTIRIEEARKDPKALEREIFSEEFLLKRPGPQLEGRPGSVLRRAQPDPVCRGRRGCPGRRRALRGFRGGGGRRSRGIPGLP